MKVFRKKVLILMITGFGVLSLLNVSIQVGRIVDFFSGVNLSILLAEEITEEGSSEKESESFSKLEVILTRESHILHNLSVNSAVDIILHAAALPQHPHFEMITPPPEA